MDTATLGKGTMPDPMQVFQASWFTVLAIAVGWSAWYLPRWIFRKASDRGNPGARRFVRSTSLLMYAVSIVLIALGIVALIANSGVRLGVGFAALLATLVIASFEVVAFARYLKEQSTRE